MNFKITIYTSELSHNQKDQLINLFALFRQTLRLLKSKNAPLDLQGAKEEVNYYIENKFPLILAFDSLNNLIGFILLKEDHGIIWVEYLYVLPKWRRNGVASALFHKAEEFMQKFDQETLYLYIHPNNHKMIQFLDRLNYNVLNLIEIRKKRKEETLNSSIQVGEHNFRY